MEIAYTDTKEYAQEQEIKQLILLALGETSALFMSNPKSGTRQIMPSQELINIAADLAMQITFVIKCSSTKETNNNDTRRNTTK